MIKFGDLGVTNERAIQAVVDVMRSGRFINGPAVAAFEQKWANECKASACVLTASGSAALIAVLKQLKTNRTNHVIMPALSFAATSFAAVEAGCVPVYVDVDEHGLMLWNQVEDYLTHHRHEVVAVMPVHLYGQVLSIPIEVSDKIPVIQDACQAHGKIDMSNDGTAIACFSFYPAKNLGAIGDAGAVVFKGLPSLVYRIREYINYGDGPGEKYAHNIQGNNLRCDTIQAAYLLENLNDFDQANYARENLAYAYIQLGISSIASAKSNAWHLYPILVAEPDRFRHILRDYNVETGNHYPYILPKITPGVITCVPTNAEFIANHVVTLPLHPRLTFHDIKYVCDIIKTICEFDGKFWIIKG